MAEAMLRSKLPGGSGIEVASAGTVGDGTPPPELAVQVMDEIGLDIAGRPSRLLDPDILSSAALVVVMTRQHLVEVATIHPSSLERAFTLADLVDRAGRAGGRTEGETVETWARRMSGGRTRASILQLPSRFDIPDPMGRERGEFERTRDLLDRLTSDLAAFLTGSGPPPREAPHPVAAPPLRQRLRPWTRPI